MRPQNIRIFAALLTIILLGGTMMTIISASDESHPYPEITDSIKDLTEYALPDSSRYHTATVMPDTWVFTDGLGDRKSVV